jgi:hypothetical protein
MGTLKSVERVSMAPESVAESTITQTVLSVTLKIETESSWLGKSGAGKVIAPKEIILSLNDFSKEAQEEIKGKL